MGGSGIPPGERHSPREKISGFVFGGLLVPAVLYAGYWLNPILSHDLAELFGIVVACGIFMLTWNARKFIDNHYFLYLGIAFLFIGLIDFLHSFSFAQLYASGQDTDSIELWFAARFLESFALLTAPLFATRKIRPAPVFFGYLAAALALVGMVYYGFFPNYYNPGTGITGAKNTSEYVVSATQLLSIGILYLVRGRFDPDVFRLLVLSTLFSVAADISAVFYTDAFIYSSVLGHYFNVISFYLIYKAVISTGLVRPYDLLFRNLKKSEEETRAARDELETRVAERTAELQNANLRLEQELVERQRAAEMRELILDLLQRIGAAVDVKEFLSLLASFLKERFSFDSIGIRYHRGADYPYFETVGFSKEFLQTEMNLCSTYMGDDEGTAGRRKPRYECTCGAVISGCCDRSLPFFTEGGSFWTNSASDLIAAGGTIESIATRGKCFRQGYESIALVPLRLGESTFGLLQMNDRRKDMIAPHVLARLERVAENASAVLARLIAKEALLESEDRFRSLVENSSVGIFIVREGRILFWNPRQELFFGWIGEGLPIRELGAVHPEDVAKFERLCDARDPAVSNMQGTDIRLFSAEKPSGRKKIRWLHCQSNPIHFHGRPSILVEMVDVTRLKDLEQVVTVREKLASIGQLAAGIAHEVRNPLSGININISTLAMLCERWDGYDLAEKEKIRAVITQARDASEKISSVINRIMEFSRPALPRMDLVDINRVVREASALSELTNRNHSVEFRVLLFPEPLHCRVDSALLEQVLLNLVINAIQALDTIAPPGRIEVTAEREGGLAVIRVADNGPGVPEHLREKIFEPFYTTRKDGHGIGLSFCNRIVTDHGGKLSVGPSADGGAEFRVELPLAEERSPV